VNLVVGTEVLLEEGAVLHHPVEDEQRFAAGDPGAESASLMISEGDATNRSFANTTSRPFLSRESGQYQQVR
jgi:hypothetical protein